MATVSMPFKQRKTVIAVLLLLFVSTAWSAHSGPPCDYPGTLLQAVGDIAVKQMEMTFSEKDQDYVESKALYFTRTPSSYSKVLVATKEAYDDQQPELCLQSFHNFDACCTGSGEACSKYEGRYSQCLTSPVANAHSTQATDSSGGSDSDGCSFDGTLTKWNLSYAGPDTLVHTWVNDREVKECGGAARRYIRREVMTYKVIKGCLLGAKAQGCVPGVPTCKPCGPGSVVQQQRLSLIVRSGDDHEAPISYCVPRAQACSLDSNTFIGCPSGHQAEAYNGTDRTVRCALCGPHAINGEDPDDEGSGLTVECQRCPDYTEAPGLGNTDCYGCKAGQYPTSKVAPIKCTDCPPGTYNEEDEAQTCTKCPELFYQDKPGQKSCKRCPTEWRCLVPANLLDKFQFTPHRWDASGNSQCASLDGKECWKDSAISCAKKLAMLEGLIKQGKLKSLTCGAEHKKVWGYTGYDRDDHWCSITRKIFMIPGRPNVGATSCAAEVTNTTLPIVAKTIDTTPACDCDRCKSCSQVCSLG